MSNRTEPTPPEQPTHIRLAIEAVREHIDNPTWVMYYLVDQAAQLGDEDEFWANHAREILIAVAGEHRRLTDERRAKVSARLAEITGGAR
jgi:hypothetical protein